MATEVFSWGYVAWLTQRPSGYSRSGYIDGHEFEITADTPQEAERAFARAARRSWRVESSGAFEACQRARESQ